MEKKRNVTKYVYLEKFIKVKEKILERFAKNDADRVYMYTLLNANRKKIYRLEGMLVIAYLLIITIAIIFARELLKT